MTELFAKKVTIYNDIPKNAVEDRHFDRFVIERCNVGGGFISRADQTIENIVNAKTVTTKDIKRYKTPAEYSALPVDIRKDYYTANIGDFIVFDEVDDEVTTSAEFIDLRKKYNDNGMTIRTVTEYLYGMSIDNVTMANVG